MSLIKKDEALQEQKWMELPREERSIGPNLSTEFDLTPYSRMGDDCSVVEVGVEETLQQGIDLRKFERTRQIEANGVKPVAPEPEPSQPLPSVPSESEPEEHSLGKVNDITYSEKGQLLRQIAARRGPWYGMPSAVKRSQTEKRMKAFHLRLTKRTGLDAASEQQNLLPPIPEEERLTASLLI